MNFICPKGLDCFKIDEVTGIKNITVIYLSMSLTIQQIITDAKRLANRLKERDLTADALLNETQVINKKIEAMKQVNNPK